MQEFDGEFKVGDIVRCDSEGEGVVDTITHEGIYPIVVQFFAASLSFTSIGEECSADTYPSLHFVSRPKKSVKRGCTYYRNKYNSKNAHRGRGFDDQPLMYSTETKAKSAKCSGYLYTVKVTEEWEELEEQE